MAKEKEHIIVSCKFSWIACAFGYISGVISFFLFIVGLFYIKEDVIVPISFFCITLFIALLILISMKTRKLYITDKAVVGKIGFIRVKKMVCPIGRVQDISYKYSLLGRIFHYSTVTVTTAGSAFEEMKFGYVKNAEELQNAFIERAN